MPDSPQDEGCGLADWIVVNDNQSTDRSRELALKLGADEVRVFSTGGEFRDDQNAAVRNECWKGLKGKGFDWVIMVDMDELLYHNDLFGHLRKCKLNGTTICVPQGYQMVSETIPENDHPIIEQVRYGTYSHKFSKPVVFDPDAIDHMCFGPGAHRANPFGRVVVDASGSLKLLHFSWLSLDWILAKHQRGLSRMSDINKSNRWGYKYGSSVQAVEAEYNELLLNSFDAIENVEAGAVLDNLTKERQSRIGPPRKRKCFGRSLRKGLKRWAAEVLSILR